MRCVVETIFSCRKWPMTKHVVTGASKGIGAAHGRGKYGSEVAS